MPTASRSSAKQFLSNVLSVSKEILSRGRAGLLHCSGLLDFRVVLNEFFSLLELPFISMELAEKMVPQDCTPRVSRLIVICKPFVRRNREQSYQQITFLGTRHEPNLCVCLSICGRCYLQEDILCESPLCYGKEKQYTKYKVTKYKVQVTQAPIKSDQC